MQRVSDLSAHPIDFTKKLLVALLLLIAPCTNQASAARSPTGLQVDTPQELRAIAFRRHLENHFDTSLDFYQKAIDKSTREYGANSTYTGDLYFEMGMLAFSMSKFTTAEFCLTRAVQINPHSVVARIKLAELLRLREKPTQAQAQIQQSVERNVNSAEARQQLVTYLQDTNPAAAARQSFVLRQILLGIPIRPAIIKKPSPPKVESASPAKQPAAAKSDKSAKSDKATKPDKSAKGKAAGSAASKAAKPKEEHKPHAASSSGDKGKAAKAEERKTAAKKPQPAHAAAAPQPKQDAGQHDGLKEQKAQAAPVETQEEAKQPKAKAPKAESPPPQEPKAAKTPPPSHKPPNKRSHDLVPPPPAMAIPGMMLPVPAKAKPKPVKPASEGKSESAKAAPHPSSGKESTGGSSDEFDDLINWAGVKNKHKPGSKPAAPTPAEKDPN